MNVYNSTLLSDHSMREDLKKALVHTYIINLQAGDLHSRSGKTSYRQISWSIEVARLDVLIIVQLWNLTGNSAASLRNACQILDRLEKFEPEDLAVRRSPAEY